MKPIPYGRQNITEEDIKNVIETLKSDFLTQGPKIKIFEEAFAQYIGSEYAVAVANGTAALHLCTLALGIQKGDKVITTPITFAASANCVKYTGGEVVFADIDPKTYLLDPVKVENILRAYPKGTFKAIIPVDFAGRSADMFAFQKLANKYGSKIIEDACHAPGGFIKPTEGRKINCGDGQLAEMAIFSFHPVKHIACGEGGMITTNDESLYKKLLLLRTHGITKDPDLLQNNHGAWYYEMQELGYNYRLSDIQAALGTSQLCRAEQGLKRRRTIALRYANAFEKKDYILGQSGFVEGHAYHLYIIEVKDREGLYQHLRKNNIFAQVHYVPVHTMPYYKQFGWENGDFPLAEKFYEHCLSLPMFPTLTEQEQEFVIDCINSYYDQ